MLLKSIFSYILKPFGISGYEKGLKAFRFDVASALTMYARYYHNPVDIARTLDHHLPQEYEQASLKIRALASTASALASTMQENQWHFKISRSELEMVSENLIGLSNSMTTPYNCSVSPEELRFVHDCETKIRKLLKIEKTKL